MNSRIRIKMADFFILRTFLTSFSFVFSLFIAIAFVVILFEELDTFRDRDIPFGLGLTFVFLRVPHEMVRAMPMIVVLAMVGSIGNLIRHKEMLMLYIAGYTPIRLAAPLLVFMSLLLVALFWLNENLCGPLAARAGALLEMRMKGNSEGITGTAGVWLYGEGSRIIRASTFYPMNQRIEGVNVFVFQGKDNALSRRIEASHAVWNPNVRQWTLGGVVVYTIQEDGQIQMEQHDTLAYDFNREPDDFSAVTQNIEQISHGELKRLIDSIRDAGENPWMYLPDLRIKEAFPFAIFFLGMLAYAMMLNFSTAGKASGIGLGLLAVILYFMTLSLGKSFAQAGAIPPWFGAWAPNLVSFILTVYFFNRLRYEI